MFVLMRVRYPVSLPEEVARALGVELSNFMSFRAFVDYLGSTSCRPTRLAKYMSRGEAEALFGSALRKERFQRTSLFSYYFNHSWIEFKLQFDEQERLRRLYLQHRKVDTPGGIEIPLRKPCPLASAVGSALQSESSSLG